jgi:hypothetical protein
MRSMSSSFGRCLAPDVDCREAPIRAHAVQNSRVLEAIQDSGHVIMPGMGLDKGALTGRFSRLSRNEATTFRGLCSKHDQELFLSLDRGDLDVEEPSVRLLLSWRAVSHELHQNLETAAKLQTFYTGKVKAGEDDGNSPTPAAMEATSWMVTAFETFRYRSQFWDAGLSDPDWNGVDHLWFSLPEVPPVFAASGMFSFSSKRGNISRVVLNAWPSDDGLTVLFGYSKEDGIQVRRFVRGLCGSKGLHPAKFSAAIIRYLGNFVISPSHYDGWSENKRQEVERYFYDTIVQDKRVPASANTNLFI